MLRYLTVTRFGSVWFVAKLNLASGQAFLEPTPRVRRGLRAVIMGGSSFNIVMHAENRFKGGQE